MTLYTHASLSRRQLLRTFAAAGLWMAARPSLPTLHAQTTACTESITDLNILCAQVEALTVTFCYRAITFPNGFFTSLPATDQDDLRAMLKADWSHYRYFVDTLATTVPITRFYFPQELFGPNDRTRFLTVLETLKRLAGATYINAVGRFAELREPVRAAICGQMASIEAEHRTASRRMARSSPPNNLCYEELIVTCAAGIYDQIAPFLTPSSGSSGPVELPSAEEIEVAAGGVGCEETAPAQAAFCDDTLATLLANLAIVEAISVTTYYRAIRSPFFLTLPVDQQGYLRAALDEERTHLNFWTAQGAAPPPREIFFEQGSFDNLVTFGSLMLAVEAMTISVYLAAIQRLIHIGQIRLAQIAAQCVGVEGSHRMLARVLSALTPAANACLARASYPCVSAARNDIRPFIANLPGSGREGFALPATTQIDTAVGALRCTRVYLAGDPKPIYLPSLFRS